MPQRDHAVIVEPQRWKRPTVELARLLVPMTGAELGVLARVLERGPMTVEGDLSLSDAEALARRLQTLGVPVRVAQAGVAADPAREPERPRALRLPRPAEEPESPRSVVDEAPTSGDTSEGGWGALFPDLAPSSGSAQRPVPSLDELSGEEHEHMPPALVPDRLRGTLSGLPVSPVGHADDEAPPAAKPEHTPPLAREVQPPPPSPATTPDRRTPASFAGGSLISELVGSSQERPPYEPAGFDPRPEHLTAVATILSALAPGAGQVFNGDGARALDYGLKFFLVKPWIDSVRDAQTRAEKIRTHWAPRPEEGTFWRALRYAGAWWLSVGLCITLVVWGVKIAGNLSDRTPETTIGPAQWARAVEEGQMKALAARVAALDAVQAAAADIVRDPPFTMSDAERASRLFVIGYAECRTRNLVMCEQMMKRVAELVPGHARALKLQAWASVAQRGRSDALIPDVGDVPTLSDIEMRELRQEMTLQGETVPPEPPEAQTP